MYCKKLSSPKMKEHGPKIFSKCGLLGLKYLGNEMLSLKITILKACFK